MTDLDFCILDWIQAHLRCGVLDYLMPRITVLGNAGIFWILITCVLMIIPRTRRLGVASALALMLDLLLVNLTIKPLVNRIRPYDLREGITLLIKAPTDSSYPSGHTAASFAAAFSLLLSARRQLLSDRMGLVLGIPSVVLAALIAASRLYLYVHYPSDVLGGLICGLLCGTLGAVLAAKIVRKFYRNRQI